ncbi:hypothetical protein [Lysinibacillus sphaericus]|nr:hypothetical protein [Lysinibacillus sphaericus]
MNGIAFDKLCSSKKKGLFVKSIEFFVEIGSKAFVAEWAGKYI